MKKRHGEEGKLTGEMKMWNIKDTGKRVFLGLSASMLLAWGMAGCAKEAVDSQSSLVSEVIEETAEDKTQEEVQIYGKVTAISVNELTIALAERPSDAGQEPVLTGEEQMVSVTEETMYLKGDEEASFDDIRLDDMVTAVRQGKKTLSITVMRPAYVRTELSKEAENTVSAETKGANMVTDGQEWTDAAFDSEEADVSAIVVSDGGILTLSNSAISKKGDTSNISDSEFYGVNAALLVKSGSSATVDGCTIESEAEGANAVFATGKNAIVRGNNLKIHTSGNSVRGLDATYGGSIEADTVEIRTEGVHSAALAAGRGGGTVQVTNGTLHTEGEGSPCIYSTGEITVTDSSGTAAGASIAVIEGKNSITLKNSILEGYGTGRAGGGIDDAGVMLYQSMTEDAKKGTGTFSAADSTLGISKKSEKYDTAPMFFVTNTDALIQLENTELNYGSGILLKAAGNDGKWGRQGENGGNVVLNAKSQELSGNVEIDQISSVALNLESSSLEGCVDGKNSGNVTMILDKDSTWTVTGDSHVFILTNEDESCSNIRSDGHTVYYDASSSANAWLNGSTVLLQGGGRLTPAQ